MAQVLFAVCDYFMLVGRDIEAMTGNHRVSGSEVTSFLIIHVRRLADNSFISSSFLALRVWRCKLSVTIVRMPWLTHIPVSNHNLYITTAVVRCPPSLFALSKLTTYTHRPHWFWQNSVRTYLGVTCLEGH